MDLKFFQEFNNVIIMKLHCLNLGSLWRCMTQLCKANNKNIKYLSLLKVSFIFVDTHFVIGYKVNRSSSNIQLYTHTHTHTLKHPQTQFTNITANTIANHKLNMKEQEMWTCTPLCLKKCGISNDFDKYKVKFESHFTSACTFSSHLHICHLAISLLLHSWHLYQLLLPKVRAHTPSSDYLLPSVKASKVKWISIFIQFTLKDLHSVKFQFNPMFESVNGI